MGSDQTFKRVYTWGVCEEETSVFQPGVLEVPRSPGKT